MRQKSLLKTMLLLCALIAGSSAWAADVTFSYSDYKGGGTQSSGSEYTMTKTDVSIKNTKFYCGSSASYAQFYASGTTTITPANGVTITQIVLTASATNYNGYQNSGTITASTGSVSGSTSSTTVTWTGSATSAFTISNNKQIRWTSIVVTYSKASDSPLAFIALSGTYPTTFTVGDEFSHTGMTVTATYENNSTSDVTSQASFSGYNMSIAGSQTVTVSYTEGAVTKTESYSIKVKGTADLAFTPSSVIVGTGSEESVSFTKSTDASITFEVIDPTIATYNAETGKIEGLKEGTTTLKATAEATEDYAAGEATCTIKVIDPYWIDFTEQGYVNAQDVTSVSGLYGTVTFDKGSNSNGNSPKWYDSGSAVRIYTDNTVKVTAKSGYALSAVEFSVTSGSMSKDNFDKTVTKGSGNDFTLETPAAEITYTTSSNFRIDKVKIILATLTKSVTEAGWATYAPQYAVEFAAEEAYIIKVADDTETVLTEVSSVPAGTPVLLKGAGDHTMSVKASSSTDVSDNCLKVSDGTAKDNIFVLADGNYGVGFYLWTGTSALSAGKIYMEPNAITSRAFFSLDGKASGIAATLTNGEVVKSEVYNLSGQRVAQPTKGLYIVNGKKMIIK